MPKRSLEEAARRLMRVLSVMKRPMSTREIAKRAGIDWRTARKLLHLFYDFSMITPLVKSRRGASIVWLTGTLHTPTKTPAELRKFTELTEAVLSLREAEEVA